MTEAANPKNGAMIFGGRFVLKVAREKLEAFLISTDELGMKAVDYEQIMREIRANGVIYGLLPAPEPVADDTSSFCVARGREPVKGRNAEITMHVKASNVRTPKFMDPSKDQVDYRELGAIVNVKDGTLLLEIIPPTEGEPGMNVMGQSLPPKPGKEIKLKIGPGVEMSEDESKVFSRLDGKFIMIDGKPAVYSEHTVKGNIDMSVGNIIFGGTALRINGDVLPGFQVKCRGSISIGGGVNNALIMAGGNIEIGGSVVGEETVVKSRGNIKVEFVENGPHLEASGFLVVGEYIMQGVVKIGRDLDARPKGTIIGGKLVVGGSVYVNELGSEAEVATEINVGVDLSLQAKKDKLNEELPLWSGRLNELIKDISGFQKMKKEMGHDFPPERLDKLKKYTEVMPKLMEKVDRMSALEIEIQAEMDRMIDECVYIYGTVYPGVLIRIGNAVRMITVEDEQVIAHFDRISRQIHLRKMTVAEREAKANQGSTMVELKPLEVEESSLA
ncbi:MAG: FapA family protein [Proteobacteria bacterium]|nr:FapA family protein [Pseudomonadota bacterium]MBU1715232.1 FapA family protein [Pseudomonadota bacterium]